MSCHYCGAPKGTHNQGCPLAESVSRAAFPWRVVADDPMPRNGQMYPVMLANGSLDYAISTDRGGRIDYDSPHSGVLENHLKPILWYFIPEPRPSEFGFVECDSCQCYVPADEIQSMTPANVGCEGDFCARCRGEDAEA